MVTVHYVQQAGENLNIGRSSAGIADILLTLGGLLLGAAIGVGSSYATADHRTNFQSWFVLISVIAAVVGALLVGSGVTLKWKSR